MNANHVVLAASLALAAWGCDAIAPEPNDRALGVTEGYGESAHIVMPDSALAGEEFPVDVWTWGGGCTAPAETEVAKTETGALIEPYDLDLARPGIACASYLRSFSHIVSLRFDRPGLMRITVRGHRSPDGELVTHRRLVRIY